MRIRTGRCCSRHQSLAATSQPSQLSLVCDLAGCGAEPLAHEAKPEASYLISPSRIGELGKASTYSSTYYCPTAPIFFRSRASPHPDMLALARMSSPPRVGGGKRVSGSLSPPPTRGGRSVPERERRTRSGWGDRKNPAPADSAPADHALPHLQQLQPRPIILGAIRGIQNAESFHLDNAGCCRDRERRSRRNRLRNRNTAPGASTSPGWTRRQAGRRFLPLCQRHLARSTRRSPPTNRPSVCAWR